MELLAYILGAFTTLFAVLSMQFKNMKWVLVCQICSNSILALQYMLEGRISVSGVVILAIAQTVVSFVIKLKGKEFPIWLIGVFIAGYTAVSLVMMTSAYDLITCVAVWLFALCVVQKNSALCRVYSIFNTLLWLIYDIICAPSAILIHIVVLAFDIAGVVRLDREEWKTFFVRLLKSKKKAENARKNENV